MSLRLSGRWASARSLLGSFIRPLASLLDLVRDRKLRPAEIPVGQLTKYSSDYVNQVDSLPLTEVGELASLSSALILAKSSELTPWLLYNATGDLEYSTGLRGHGLGTLEGFGAPTAEFGRRWLVGIEVFPRADFVDGAGRIEHTVALSPSLLSKAFTNQINEMRVRGQARMPPPVFLRVEAAIRSLQQSIRSLRSFTFVSVVRDQSLDRRATVVYFLAMLDLARKGLVNLHQSVPFDDIVLERSPAGEHSLAESPRELAGV